MTTISTLTLAPPSANTRALPVAYWLLRIGAALCFIGHGAFGFITKAAWVPYFGVVGIPEPWAWRLMPLVGAVDVLAAMAVLYAPRGIPLVYMAVWATWTALLRPLAGEPVWESLERAGNYGVPLAMLALTGWPKSWSDLWRARSEVTDGRHVATILRWTTAVLLFGHGAIAAFAPSASLTRNLGVIGIADTSVTLVGWFEIALAVAILLRPTIGLLIFAGAWKLATESLWIAAGTPIWEFVERAGSYVAPLALAALLSRANHVSSRAQRGTSVS
jgi:hypothetical protein